MDKSSCDIFISGGGVAGLTAASAFGAAGFDVTIVDPSPPITNVEEHGADLRTTAFLQPARNFLVRAKVWDQLKPHSTPLQTMRILDTSRPDPVAREFTSDDISDEPFGWNLPNWLLRREMVQRLNELPNVDFKTGVGFKSMVGRTSGALIKLSDGSQLSTQLVIAADGRGSPVRNAVGIKTKTTRYGQSALTFAVSHDAPHDNISTEVHRSGGPFTLVPLPDHDGQPRSAVVWMTDNADARRLMTLDDKEFSSEATDRSAHIMGSLQLITRRTVWPIISQLADRLIAPRTALVAEAAHVMPPIGAQGLNMSLTDLATLLELSEANRSTLGNLAMLQSYEKARHNDIKLRVKGIDLLNRASMLSNPLLQNARRFGIRALHDVKPIRTTLMQMGLGAKS